VDELYNDPVRIYLREVTAVPPLSPEDEAACVRHVRAGDDEAERAASILIEAHLALVVSIARRYGNGPAHVLGLIQEGNNGLLLALKTLPDNQEDEFAVHAAVYVERAIADAVTASRSGGVD